MKKITLKIQRTMERRNIKLVKRTNKTVAKMAKVAKRQSLKATTVGKTMRKMSPIMRVMN